ncbi:MAG: tetratricopeptide repeat protein [Salinivirgaceae bacterium]|nr:tetratricopeptide repeat protein [Salinivirgaceae bacterium]
MKRSVLKRFDIQDDNDLRVPCAFKQKNSEHKKHFHYTFFVISFLLMFCIKGFSQSSVEDSLASLSAIAVTEGNIKEHIRILYELDGLYKNTSQWQKYDSISQLLIEIGEKYDNFEVLAEAFNSLGIANSIRGKNSDALHWFKKALEINMAQKDSESVSNSYENIAKVYEERSMYDSAVIYQLKSIEIREKLNLSRLFNNYVGLSIIYSSLGDNVNKYRYLEKCRQFLLNNKSTDYSQYAILHNIIGGFYNDDGNVDSMLYHYQKTYDYAELGGWKHGMVVALGNLAETYFAQGDYHKSLTQRKQVLAMSFEIEDMVGIIEEYAYIGIIFQKLGLLDSAAFYTQKSLNLAQKHQYTNEERNANNYLAEIAELSGNHAMALQYYKQYIRLHDSLFNLEREANTNELITKYETKKKEQQIELLLAVNTIKNQRLRLGIVILIFIIALLGFVVVLYIQKRRRSKLMESELQQKLSRVQMNPHFVYNALASIQTYMYANDGASAARFLGKFAGLNRAVLEHSMVEKVSLDEELTMLRNYLEIEQLRLGTSFEYCIDYHKDLELDFIFIPPLLIQPFVENAIKHGVKDLDRQGKITLIVEDLGKFVKIIVQDNGHGIDFTRKENTSHRSRAMEIVQKRLQMLRKRYKGLPEIVFQSLSEENKTGTRVVVYLPIIVN